MTQRIALIIAVVLTAFLLVVSGGVIARVSQGDVKAAVAAPAAAAPQTTNSATSDMAAQVQAIIQERETAYRDLIAQANARLLAAEQRSAAAPAPARATLASSQPKTTTQTAPVVAVSPDAALGIAYAAAPSGMPLVRGPELVLYNGVVAYEVVFKHGSIYVDANSGQILFNGTKHGSRQASAPAPKGGGEHDDGKDD
jgi:hypothetical protein